MPAFASADLAFSGMIVGVMGATTHHASLPRAHGSVRVTALASVACAHVPQGTQAAIALKAQRCFLIIDDRRRADESVSARGG